VFSRSASVVSPSAGGLTLPYGGGDSGSCNGDDGVDGVNGVNCFMNVLVMMVVA
jgi:hypothetical protein